MYQSIYLYLSVSMYEGIEGMQATLEAETKAKVEALRMKKKLETDVADLETGIYNQTTLDTRNL